MNVEDVEDAWWFVVRGLGLRQPGLRVAAAAVLSAIVPSRSATANPRARTIYR